MRSIFIAYHDNDVTMVLALLSNFSPYLHFLKKLIYVTTKCLSSAVPSFTKICQRNFEILWNFYMKGIISALIEDWTLCK